jgi:NAD(P)-dependent dehydrogenase (short-subunit alcohol dehydrogenase family)
MEFFRGKTAIVTGGGSGIGRALALALADRGCAVAVTDIVPERVDAVVEEIKRRGVQASGYVVDHSRLEEVRAFAEAFYSDWWQVDILCSNAGVGLGARFTETSIEDWEWLLGINLWGCIYMMHEFVPRMVERGEGSILLTVSDAGLISIPAMAAYQTSKYGVMGLGETLRMELYEHNIKVSMLCPGIIDTNIIDDGRVYLVNSKGKSAKAEMQKFYRDKGVDPSIVAEAGMRALEKDLGIVLAPWSHSGPQYVLKRISPALYHAIFRFLWKHGVLHKVFGAER